MNDSTLPGLGNRSEELTLYVGPVKDTGIREVFLSVRANGRTYQGKARVADWLSTEALIGCVTDALYAMEVGALPPYGVPARLIELLGEAEIHPF